MSFREGQAVELKTFGMPIDGKHVEVKGTITKLTPGHAIVCFKSITPGVRLAVKRTGALALLGSKDKLEPDWTLLDVGDIEAVPLDDLSAVQETKPAPEWITREHAEHWLGKYAKDLDHCIEKGIIKQNVDGLLRCADVTWYCAAIPTYIANSEKEQRKFGDAAKEFNRLGSQLHPGIFGKAW
jgi:hypothetical protein